MTLKRFRVGAAAAVGLYVGGGLLGWLQSSGPLADITTARPDEIFEPRAAVWVLAVAPLLGLIDRPAWARVPARAGGLLAAVLAVALIWITWTEDPVPLMGDEDEPAFGLWLSTVGAVGAAGLLAVGTATAFRCRRR